MHGQRLIHALCAWAAARGQKEAPGEGPNRRNAHAPPEVAAPEPHWGRNADIRANLPFLHRRGPAKKKQGPAAAGGRGEGPARKAPARPHVARLDKRGAEPGRPHVARLDKRDADRVPARPSAKKAPRRGPGKAPLHGPGKKRAPPLKGPGKAPLHGKPPGKAPAKPPAPALDKERLREKMRARKKNEAGPAPRSDGQCACECEAASIPSYVGDGWCDAENNLAPCYDGGDCCAETCNPDAYFTCGIAGYSCDDPNAAACASRSGYACESVFGEATWAPWTYYYGGYEPSPGPVTDDAPPVPAPAPGPATMMPSYYYYGGGWRDDTTYVADCADADECPDYWVGDGVCDGVDQAYGCDLTCYENDGGDCDTPAFTDWGFQQGWCYSELDEYVGSVYSIEECWGLCEDTYGSELVAVDLDTNYYCYCQHDCQCLDEGHGGGYYVATSDAIPELPGPCGGGGGGGGDDDSSSLADCAADGDDCPAYWVGDGVCDGVDQAYGCDLSCYHQDGGDCCGGYACGADDDNYGTWDDGDDASYGGGSVEDCSGDGDSCPEIWIGDGVCDGLDQAYGCDLSCYERDGGDCCDGYACAADDDYGYGYGGSWTPQFSYSYEGACPASCYGSSCDVWTMYGYTCASLEGDYDCDCSGCACEEFDFDWGYGYGSNGDDYAGDCADANGYDCCAAAIPSWVGDGYCDAENNESPCFDGGDCCESTCVTTAYECGINGYACRDPSTYDCDAAADAASVGDGTCDAANNVEPCYDGGDCCAETCVGSACGDYQCADVAILSQQCDEAMACSACGAGCSWCAADLVCAASSDLPTLEELQQSAPAATCTATRADYSDTGASCPARDDPVEDPYYEAAAWYLEAIRAPDAWAAGYTGAGVQILVNDNGVDNTHPDLAKLDVANSCDVYAPSGWDAHGTVCASLAAGDANSHCGVGAAPGAGIASCTIMGANLASESYDGSFISKNHDVNDISSNSWGYDLCERHSYAASCPFSCPSGTSSCPCDVCDGDDWSSGDLSSSCEAAVVSYCSYYFESDATPCLELDHYFVQCGFGQMSSHGHDTMLDGVTNGRGGLGMVFVFAAGNSYDVGQDVNYEGYQNSRFTMSVGALGQDLKHASYSSTGAPVFISAPGGDSENYHGMLAAQPLSHGLTDNCGDAGMGTSYAAPLVSGVVALVLEANPNLTWRDVQGVLASTATRPHEDAEDQWTTNQAGVKHSYKYGFGLVDAAAATTAATTWTTWGAELTLMTQTVSGEALVDFDGAEHWVESEAAAFGSSEFVIEGVAVYVTIKHPRRGDLRIELERNGVTSLLTDDKLEFGTRYTHHKYTTLRHWGERADEGAFTLRVADRRAGSGDDDDLGSNYWADYYADDDGDDDGLLVSWTLQLYGHDADPTTQETPQPTLGPPTITRWGSGLGWCDSDLDYEIGSYSGDECWRQCEAIYGPALVAVDWDTEGYCYCQNDCRCMNDVGYPDGFLATAEAVAELPSPCSYEYSYSYDVCDEPTCPDGSAATCCDVDGSCTDGDDDYCCGADYYCSNDGAEYAAAMGGRLCCPCTENCVACDGSGSEDCLQCDSGYVLNDEDGDGAGSCADDSESGTDGTVPDCSGDGENCPDSWVGDGYCDGADQVYGCDLTCYDNDGGDCEPPPTAWAPGAGWCASDLDESVGTTVSAQACWDKCVDTHGADVVKAIDWWSGECWCQDDCQCMEDQGDGDIHLMTAADIAALPDRCVGPCPDEEAAYQTCITENDSARGDDDGDDGDDGDDDVGSLSTCADVQARFSDQCELFGLWQCREPWFAYVECQVEDLAASELNLNCDLDCRPPSPQPTASPTLSPTPAPFIVGEVTFEGLDEADADAHEDVIVDAIAEVAGVCPVSHDELHDETAIAARCPPGATPAVVTILGVSSSSRRRLDHVAGHTVVIEYEVETVDVAAIEDVESALAKAEEDTTLVDEALEDAAKAATLEAAQTGGDTSVAQAFASVATTQLHSEVVAPSPAPTAVPTLAPTASPTTVEYYEKQQRKERLRIAALIGIVVAAIVVAGCAAVAIVAVAMGKGPCKKKKKVKMVADGGPSAPPAPVGAEEAPPLAPITLKA